MEAHSPQIVEKLMNSHVFALLKEVLRKSHEHSKSDSVSRALLYFLCRVCNTWQSIWTLRKHSPNQSIFMVDAGMLLRAMFDAYLQAEYMLSDPVKAVERANDYLDFEHVERHKQAERTLHYNNELTTMLELSPRRIVGEKKLEQEYNRVKNRYPGGKKDRIRDKWYPGNLSQIAQILDKKAEYDGILAVFHGCVHSSALAVRLGPPISPEYVSHWASTIAARVAKLSVVHNGITIDEGDLKVLAQLSGPYAWLASP